MDGNKNMGNIEYSNIAKIVKHDRICNGDLHPISSQIDLSNYCNLKCSFCTHGEDHLKKDMIKLELLYKILDKLYNAGCKGIEYTGGGEPLLHPNFVEIINKTKERFDVGLVSNGTLIKKMDTKIWKNFDWIRISVNAGPTNYKKIQGKNKFKDVMDGLFILDSCSNFYGISYVYSEQNLFDIQELSEKLNQLKNLKYFRIARDVLKSEPEQGTVQNILNKIKSVMNPDIKIIFQIDRNMWIPKKCIMYKIKPRIDIFGNFYPCCVSHYKKIHPMGSIIDFNFNKEIEIDTSKCPYCIYGHINNFCVEVQRADIKNKNFI